MNQSQVEDEVKCIECDHRNVSERGVCIEGLDLDPLQDQFCGCHCVFPGQATPCSSTSTVDEEDSVKQEECTVAPAVVIPKDNAESAELRAELGKADNEIVGYQEKLREQQKLMERYELDFNDLIESGAAEVKSLQNLCDGLQSQLERKEREVEAERALKWIHFENAAKFDEEIRELKRQLLAASGLPAWQPIERGWPKNGWYWMRGFRHYRSLPVEIEGEKLSMMFATGTYTAADLQGVEFYPISQPTASPTAGNSTTVPDHSSASLPEHPLAIFDAGFGSESHLPEGVESSSSSGVWDEAIRIVKDYFTIHRDDFEAKYDTPNRQDLWDVLESAKAKSQGQQGEVEAALAELRKIAPTAKFVTVAVDYIDFLRADNKYSTRVQIASNESGEDSGGFFHAPTLAEAMQKVREWKQSQEGK